jgi:hypothetical protein
MSTNHFSSAADFRQLTRFEVLLPSGRKILMRPPSLAFTLANVPRFETLAARFLEADKVPPTEQEAAEFEAWMDHLLVDVVVEPRVSLTPKDESELHPREIPVLDRLIIFRRAVGEIAPEGADLADFRGETAGATAAPGASGGDLSLPPEPDAGPDGDDGGVPI